MAEAGGRGRGRGRTGILEGTEGDAVRRAARGKRTRERSRGGEGRRASSLIAKGGCRTVGRDVRGVEGGRLGRQGGLPKTDMDCRLFWTSGCGLAKG